MAEGKHTFFVSLEESAAGCGQRGEAWTYSTVLVVVRADATRTLLTIHEDGVGCEFVLTRSGAHVYAATEQDCAWSDPVNMTGIGVLSRSFSNYELDLGTGHLTASGRLLVRTQRQVRSQCFEIDADITRL
jgi:hypothetical protein